MKTRAARPSPHLETLVLMKPFSFVYREMAVGNTFGATALSSYGGFWLSFAIILTPGGFQIVDTLESEGGVAAFHDSFGLYLFVRASSLTPLDLFCISSSSQKKKK